MPDRTFVPTHVPAKLWERVLIHPFENVFAVMSGIFSILSFLGSVAYSITPSKAFDQLPPSLLLVISVVLAVGSVLTLTGLHWHGEKVSTGWHLEELGWSGIFCGMLCYAIVVYAEFPDSVFSWIIPSILCLGAVLRVIALLLIEKGTRRVIQKIKGAKE